MKHSRKECTSLALGIFTIGLMSLSAKSAASEDILDKPDSEVLSDDFVENFDDELAAAIAKDKVSASGLDLDALVPRAAACGKRGSTSFSKRVNDAAINGAARQRSGSSIDCTAPGSLQPSDDALYYCYTIDASFKTWTYLKNIRTGVSGWVRDDLLRNGGTTNYCGF